MAREIVTVVSGELVDEDQELSLAQLCRACGLEAEVLIDMVAGRPWYGSC